MNYTGIKMFILMCVLPCSNKNKEKIFQFLSWLWVQFSLRSLPHSSSSIQMMTPSLLLSLAVACIPLKVVQPDQGAVKMTPHTLGLLGGKICYDQHLIEVTPLIAGGRKLGLKADLKIIQHVTNLTQQTKSLLFFAERMKIICFQ